MRECPYSLTLGTTGQLCTLPGQQQQAFLQPQLHFDQAGAIAGYRRKNIIEQIVQLERR